MSGYKHRVRYKQADSGLAHGIYIYTREQGNVLQWAGQGRCSPRSWASV